MLAIVGNVQLSARAESRAHQRKNAFLLGQGHLVKHETARDFCQWSQFGKRVFSVHLKDVKNIDNNGKKEKKFTIIGEGDLDILGCLKALKANKYKYILAFEYEENPDNPLSDLEVGLKNVRAAAAKLS